MIRNLLRLGPALALMAACQALPGAEAGRTLEAEVVHRAADGPPGAEPGTCWGRDVTPAVVETVTEQVMVQPPELGADGRVWSQPVYRTETRQRIVQKREEIWFRAPCPEDLTPEVVATLQRALEARGHYVGPASGSMSLATRRAIRGFQRPLGLDSGVLSLRAAQMLGVVSYDRARLDDW